jgi:hypothetical protein
MKHKAIYANATTMFIAVFVLIVNLFPARGSKMAIIVNDILLGAWLGFGATRTQRLNVATSWLCSSKAEGPTHAHPGAYQSSNHQAQRGRSLHNPTTNISIPLALPAGSGLPISGRRPSCKIVFPHMMADSTTLKLYPEGELMPAPLATPLSGPKVISTTPDIERCDDWRCSSTSSQHPSTTAQRRKHESYTLSGSVFLITGNGKTLNLPTPSDIPADPLGWRKWKKAGAFLAVAWFSSVALAVAQAAGIFMRVISHEFKIDVSSVVGLQGLY